MDGNWVCIGHSHVVALTSGASVAGVTIDTINFWDTGDPWVREGNAIQLRSDLAERVLRGQIVLSVIGGSAHTVLGMVEHPRPFDFVLPSDPDIPIEEGREIIPAGAVRAKLSEIAAPYFAQLPGLLATTASPIFHLEPPPPVADEARIAPFVPWPNFPGQPRQIAPKWLRYKLWRLHSELIGSAPLAAMDEEGFLAKDFDQDGAHANAAYGALVLEMMRREI
jgi:hypothetical protein